MKTFVIINGKEIYIIKKASLEDATDNAIACCDHSKEIIVREIESFMDIPVNKPTKPIKRWGVRGSEYKGDFIRGLFRGFDCWSKWNYSCEYTLFGLNDKNEVVCYVTKKILNTVTEITLEEAKELINKLKN